MCVVLYGQLSGLERGCKPVCETGKHVGWVDTDEVRRRSCLPVAAVYNRAATHDIPAI